MTPDAAVRALNLAVGSVAEAAREDGWVALSLGPHHPSMHGLMRLHLQVQEDRIVDADPEIGFVHRGAEKLFEVRDYRQLLTLANRHDWLSALNGELGVALAIEELLGLAVPPRATWARTLLAELTRVYSHLVFLGTFPRGVAEPVLAVPEREAVQSALEAYSGGRLHVAATRIGGLHADVDPTWLRELTPLVRSVVRVVPALREELLGGGPGLSAGVLDRETAVAFGASGLVLRASGVDFDLRRDQPYLSYDELFGEDGPGRVVLADGGDVAARLHCLIEQLSVSLDLVLACQERLLGMPPGPVGVRLPKTLRVPEGETYVWTETPLGIAGYLMVSRGGRTPWRLKLRTPSFAHLSLLPELLPGTRVQDLPAVLASLCYVLGDADR